MPSTTTYTWDEENRLTNITLPNGGNEAYAYAADGLRRSKSVNSQTTRFIWDAENLLQEQRDSQIIAHYTNQPDGYGPLLSQWSSDGGNTPSTQFNAVSFGSAAFNQSENTSTAPGSSFYGFDLSANTKVLTNEIGNISDEYTNTAFGKPISNSGNTPNPYQFGGEVGYYQDSNERSYVRARHHLVGHGRWISRDPIGFSDKDWNLYRYVRNNPVYWIDPSGLQNEYQWRRWAEAEWNAIGDWLLAPSRAYTKAEKDTHHRIASSYVEGSLAKILLKHYIYNNGRDLILSRGQVKQYLKPRVDIRDAPKFYEDLRKCACGKSCLVNYEWVISDLSNGMGGLNDYIASIQANLTKISPKGNKWKASGTIILKDRWDFDANFWDIFKDSDRRTRHLRTYAGSFINGTPFDIRTVPLTFFQKSSLMAWGQIR